MSVTHAQAGNPTLYTLYIQWGRNAIDQKDYESALAYFEHARHLHPAETLATDYINLIKRIKDDQVQYLSEPEKILLSEADSSRLGEQHIEVIVEANVEDISSDKIKESVRPVESDERAERYKEALVIPKKESIVAQDESKVYLDQKLQSSQPDTVLRIPLDKFVELEGRNIERFLVITPGYIDVRRIDRDHVIINTIKRGTTHLHVWDENGRWTFKIEVTLPTLIKPPVVKAKQKEYYAQPFSLTYSNDWSQFYRGSSFDSAELSNLNFVQTIETFGESPYGDMSGFVIFNKFDQSTEATGYGVALKNGHIGPFKDFNLSGFDAQKTFSPLTISGQYFRGGMIEAKAFDKKIEYTYLYGRDRQTFGFVSPGIRGKRESFVQGAQVTFFPEEDDQVSINYGQAFGDAKEDFVADDVYSMQLQKRVDNILFNHETAYDTDHVAHQSSANFELSNHNIYVDFRDINKRFSTITNQPGNRGEVGGIINWNYHINNININSNLDIYRDRLFYNDNDKDAVNVDYSTLVDVPLTLKDRLRGSVYYINTAQEISPRENLRLNTVYSKRFNLFGIENIAVFGGGAYQRSRFDLTPSSEYDRYSLTTGLNFNIIKNLGYYINYEYSWVDELQSGELLRPRVMNTGLSYVKKLKNDITSSINITYRDEEETEGNNSFLAGEDSLSTSLGLSYRPNEDFEIFADGRFRNSWAESNSNNAFSDIDVRLGVRTTWDSPFVWNPTGIVGGFVYKDLNNNQRKDFGEEGIKDVIVFVGNQSVTTDRDGRYNALVKAKRVEVSVDINTIPKGFIFTTPPSQAVDIIAHQRQTADFGLSSESGIYGVAYVDLNQNKKPDQNDKFVSRVEVILDDKESTRSDSEGAYYFKNIEPGKHTIKININSIPVEYLPAIKLMKDVSVDEGTTYIYHIPLKAAPKKK